jgi:subtilisin family serine protease
MSAFAFFLLLSGALVRIGTTGACKTEPYAGAPVVSFANGMSIDTRITPLPEPGSRLETGTCWLVHLTGPVRREWLTRLRRLGVNPVGYIAYQTLVCRPWRDALATDLKNLEFVDWLGPYPTSAKLAPELVAASAGSENGDSPSEREAARYSPRFPSLLSPSSSLFVLSVWPGENPDAVATTIASLGGEVIKVTSRTVKFRLDAARVASLAELEPVAWIQECSLPRPFNSDVQWVMQVGWRPERPDELSGHRIWAHGIRGQNMVVGLFDSGIATEHDMFIDPAVPVTGPGLYPEHRKFVAYKLYEGAAFGDVGNFHGSAVAGTLCGDDSIAGNASKLDGVAPDCRLYFVDDANAFGVYVFDEDMTGLLDSVRLSAGVSPPVRQVSGSFGTEESLSYYRLEESSLDEVCWNDKQFFVIWAAGNSAGPSYNIGHPSCAKNALTVGACRNGTESNTVWTSSSRGPCRDERIKPNLVAPGVGVATVDGREPHAYLSASGTSISAPAASGALMLLRQYFAEGWYPTGTPDSAHRITQLSSALMRALAIAATDSNVGNEYPPNKEAGWGRLDVSTIMHFSDDSNGLDFIDEPTGVATGEDMTFQFELSGSAPLHVVLAWTDTAASPGAAIAIVNDLDLELVGPDGTRYRGNQFYNGWSRVNAQTRDSTNVEEVCLVPHPLTGRWTARVIGQTVYTMRQPFAVAVRGGITDMVPGVAESAKERIDAGAPPKTAFNLPTRPGWQVAVFAIDGKQVFKGTVPVSGLSPVPALPPGVYLYRLTSVGLRSVTGKLIVCR